MELMVNQPSIFSNDDFIAILEEDKDIFNDNQNLLERYAINLIELNPNIPQTKELVESIMSLSVNISPSIIKLKLLLE